MWFFLTLVVFAFALFKFPRQTLYVLGGLAVLIGAGVLYLQADLKRNAQGYAEQKAREATVTISAAYDLKACSAEFPLRVLISNGSTSVLNKVNWRWSAFAPGRSTDIIMYGYLNMGSSDRILQPNTQITLCYKVPELTEKIDRATLQWTTKRDDVSFAGGG